MIKRDQSKYKYARDKWREKNPDYAKNYYLSVKDNPEYKAKMAKYAKKWRDKNKEKNSKIHVNYTRKRLKSDPIFKFGHLTRSLIKKSFNRAKVKFIKRSKSEEILGCSLDEFINYILLKCPEGTTLQDFHQFGYHLDHIIPISSAKSEEDVIRLCHYANFQPLWWKDNIIKSNKIVET